MWIHVFLYYFSNKKGEENQTPSEGDYIKAFQLAKRVFCTIIIEERRKSNHDIAKKDRDSNNRQRILLSR